MEKRWYSVWPPNVPKEFEPKKPIFEYLSDVATEQPNKTALSFYGYDMTYSELDEAINRFSVGLKSLGVKRGDRVAIYMENCPQFVISYFGVLQAGGIVVSLNPMFKHAELEYELNDSGAETLVALDVIYSEVEKIKDRIRLRNIILTSLKDYLPEKLALPLPPEAERSKFNFLGPIDFSELLKQSPERPVREVTNLKEDLALLQYTGGTTGLPKGAMISHYNLSHAVIASVLWFGHSNDSVHLGIIPFFHIMGMIQSMGTPLVSGGQLVVLARFSPEVVAKAIGQYKCTTWIAATTMIVGLFGLSGLKLYDFSSFRLLCTGGAPIPLEIQTRMKQMAPNAVIMDGYGLTESCSQAGCVTPINRYKPGFAGIPTTSTDVKIVDLETGLKEVNLGEEGGIIIKGPSVMKGYWNRPEETKEVLRDGWLYTGDIGIMDQEGYVQIRGRKKEMIKCSGYSVFPTEVESLLYRHPAIAELAVIGIPDPYRGESPKAFIVLKPEYKGKVKEEEIIEWCKENMAAYKRPRVVEFREELPKSTAGKVLRRILSQEEKST